MNENPARVTVPKGRFGRGFREPSVSDECKERVRGLQFGSTFHGVPQMNSTTIAAAVGSILDSGTAKVIAGDKWPRTFVRIAGE
jgi:hypothetical protein